MAALDVDPDEVHRTAMGWRSYAAGFVSQSPPTASDGDGWASTAATGAFHERVHNANQVFHRRLHSNADLVDESARNYAQQDATAAADVNVAGAGSSAAAAGAPSHRDMAAIFSGTFKDLSGALTAGLSSAASGFGALGSAAASAAGATANATTQIGTTLAQNAAKNMSAGGVAPAIPGVNGIATHNGAGRDADNQTHVASALSAEVPAVPSAPPAAVAPMGHDGGVAASTSVAPAAAAPHGPRAPTVKAVRRIPDGSGQVAEAAEDENEASDMLPSPVAFAPAFARAVVEVPDANKP